MSDSGFGLELIKRLNEFRACSLHFVLALVSLSGLMRLAWSGLVSLRRLMRLAWRSHVRFTGSYFVLVSYFGLAGLHYTCERYIEESENSLRIAGQSVAGERLHWFRV